MVHSFMVHSFMSCVAENDYFSTLFAPFLSAVRAIVLKRRGNRKKENDTSSESSLDISPMIDNIFISQSASDKRIWLVSCSPKLSFLFALVCISTIHREASFGFEWRFSSTIHDHLSYNALQEKNCHQEQHINAHAILSSASNHDFKDPVILTHHHAVVKRPLWARQSINITESALSSHTSLSNCAAPSLFKQGRISQRCRAIRRW